ncbi:MAG: retron Ec67 family RNA-directed DNA polymerase/endonuclease [Lysobacter sp.]|nr:retron Ec67 family RNA-directed DNA polymerase/endonuclease [Lysobacter sp.]
MSALTNIKACNTFNDFARLLGFKANSLAYLLWGMHADTKYTTFDIPKRSGGKRTICAPNPKLKLAQSRLSELLQQCEKEVEVIHAVKKSLSHGFKKEHSILTNAEGHCGRRYVLNIDLEDFFGTIHFGRVRGFFIKNRQFALNPTIAMTIAQIACHENKLPQGSPCSPVISNLVANILDIRLAKLSKIHGCSYTRYADDITFSTSMPDFPESIAFKQIDSNHWVLGKPLVDAIKACKFRINLSKTRLQYRRSRQDVTGIVVNKQLNVRSEYRKALRAMVYKLRETGSFSRNYSQLGANGDTQVIAKDGSRAQLFGMLSYVIQVERWRNRRIDSPPERLSANEWLMREFLFYTMFANADRPCIVCEGKTDSIYIREAIKNLGASFPYLAKSNAGNNEVIVSLVRNTDLLARLFGLSGGETRLKDFVKNYRDEYRKIKGPKGSHPVIILFDNDSGAKDVLNLLANLFKVIPVVGRQYFHVHDNLYVMLTSPVGAGPHYIEKCFDAATLAMTLGGKTFNPANQTLGPNEYGKGFFAEKVIAPNAQSIDFSGFSTMLAEFSSIIVSHAAPSPSLPVPPGMAPSP